ncbi:corticotropin-releasing factor-binding protein [Tetranychus urticae]|uniref:Corticotropin-releasing factor-binding protein n=1 Tax=Tetranychus urticae TaxID=32264 RepID=T1KAJ5_TETUR|nr:corticotropin-releasing factor-binding protein [Tetranychus urticae]
MSCLPYFIVSFYLYSTLLASIVSLDLNTEEESNTTRFDSIDQEILDILRGDTITKLEHDERGQCIFVKSDEGVYSYTSPGNITEVCGLYVIAQPDQTVTFEFENFSVDCTDNGLISVINGWELNGQFFPAITDHPVPRDERYQEYCGDKKPNKKFEMSQNVGLIEFQVPREGDGFKIIVKFQNNPEPCNAILRDPQGVYTIKNFGRKTNCSVSIMFPESFQIISTDIGVRTKEGDSDPIANNNTVETGLMRECKTSGVSDYVEIIGGDGLDTDIMNVAGEFCGLEFLPGKIQIDIACGNTAVRMVSSGRYENSITIAFDLITQFSTSNLICPTFRDFQSIE